MTCFYEINDIFFCTLNVVATQPFLISEECSHNTQDENAINMRVSLKDSFCVVLAHEAFCCRPPHLLLHTGPLVRAPQCYSSTVSGRLPMVKKTSCDYWVIGVPGGVYWCVDSTGVHSIKYYWRKKIRPLTQQLAGSDTDLLNLSLIDPPDQSEGLEEGVSNGQKLIFGEVTTDGDRVTHCSALNLTGNTMLLKEQEQEQEEEEEEEGGGEKEKENIRCPAQKEKDEHGVERNWPAIILGKYGTTQTYSHFCLFCSMVLIAMGDFMLPLWYKLDLTFFEILRSIECWFFFFPLDCLTLENPTDRLSQNVTRNYHSALCKTPKDRKSHILIAFPKIKKCKYEKILLG